MILTGESPHASEGRGSIGEYLRRIVTGNIPRARSRDRSVPLPLDAVCAKAMALRPAHRYSTALELAEDVRGWELDEPIRAYREPWPKRLRRALVRHRRVTVVATMILVAAIVSGIVFLTTSTRKAADTRAFMLRELDTRAAHLESSILLRLAALCSENLADAKASNVDAFVAGRADSRDDARGRLSQDWIAQLERGPFYLTRGIVAMDDARPLLFVGRHEGKARVLNDPPAIVRTELDILRRHPPLPHAPDVHLVRRTWETTQPVGASLVVAIPLQVPERNCWLVSEFDLTAYLRELLGAELAADVQVFVRDGRAQPLAAVGERSALFETAAVGELDPRL